jgi:hypothetical protein
MAPGAGTHMTLAPAVDSKVTKLRVRTPIVAPIVIRPKP